MNRKSMLSKAQFWLETEIGIQKQCTPMDEDCRKFLRASQSLKMQTVRIDSKLSLRAKSRPRLPALSLDRKGSKQSTFTSIANAFFCHLHRGRLQRRKLCDSYFPDCCPPRNKWKHNALWNCILPSSDEKRPKRLKKSPLPRELQSVFDFVIFPFEAFQFDIFFCSQLYNSSEQFRLKCCSSIFDPLIGIEAVPSAHVNEF